MKIFDSHTHLNDPAFKDHEINYIKHANRLGVKQMAIVGSNRKMNKDALALAHKYTNLYAIIGWIPEDLNDCDDNQMRLLEKQLTDPNVVAVGEIGIDYHQNKTKHKFQQVMFRKQIQLAKYYGLPVAIHTRDAFEDTYRILKEEHVETIGGVIHSFNGDPYWLHKFLSLGMDVSYSGVASFKNAHDVHASIKETPLNRMLVETDAPELAPMPYRGKMNEPAYALYTLEAVARYKDVNPDVIARATYQNTKCLFRIDNLNEKN